MNTKSSTTTAWVRIAAVIMIVMLLLAAMPAAQAQARPLTAIGTRGTPTTATVLNSTTLTIAKPAGVVYGDILIANLVQVNSLTSPSISGWTKLDDADLNGTTNRFASVFYKVAGATEPANYIFTVPSGTSVQVSGAIVAFSGVDATTPFDVAAGTITVSQGANVSDASITTTTANTRILMLGQAAASPSLTWSNWNTTSPGALTELYDFQGGETTLGAASASKATTGATGTGSAQLSAGERNGGYLLALRASTAAATTTVLSALSAATYGTPVTFTATVSPSPTNGMTVQFYDGLTLLGSGTTTSGVATYTTSTTQLSATGSPHSITAVFPGNASFGPSTSATGSQVVNQKALTVTGITANSKIYDATTAATLVTGGATLVGNLDGGNVVLSTASAAGAFTPNGNVGTGKTVQVSGLSISGSASGNYTLTQPTTTADITTKALTVTGITANNKVYDASTIAALVTGGAALVGNLDGANVVLNTGGAVGTFMPDGSVGSGKTVQISGLAITGSAIANYTLTQPTTTANITAKVLTVTGITASNKVYDGTADALVDTTGAVLVGNLDGVNVVLDTTAAAGAFTPNGDVGTGKTVQISGLSISGSATGNYTLTQPTTTADITVKGLTVTGITANNKIYDATTDAALNTAGATLVGNLDGGNVILDTSSAVGTFTPDGNVGAGKTVEISGLSVSGSASGNYALTQPTTTADITAKALTVTGITASDKVYDATTDAALNTVGATLVGNLDGGNVVLDTSSATGSFTPDGNVGAGKTVQISGLLLTGPASANYTVTQPTATADITAKALTVSGITASSKVYDGSTTATVDATAAALVGVEAGDTVILDASLTEGAFTPDANAGVGKTVQLSGLTISGSSSGNYSLTQPTTTADITLKALTVTGVTASNKVYDATTAATVDASGAALVGVVGVEDVVLDTSGAAGAFTPNGNVGAGKTVQVSGLALTGADIANYTLTQPTATADITAFGITVTAQPKSKTLGAADPTLTYLVSPALLGSDTFSGALTRVSGEAVGTYAILQGTLTAGPNYTITYVGADLTISAAAVSNLDVVIGGVLQGQFFLSPSQSIRHSFVGLNSGPVKVQSTTGMPIVASERVAYFDGSNWTSFSELMGLPSNQLTTSYVLPWYNNAELNTQLRFGNVGTAGTLVTVKVGGVVQGTYFLAPSQSTRISYPGLNSGPVVISSSGNVPIIASERVAYFDGTNWTDFSELMALPSTKLTTSYTLPWYNNAELNTQLRFGNVGTAPTNVTVTVGGVVQGTYFLVPSQALRVSYAGLNSGPVVITSSGGVPIIASERVAYFDGTNWTSFSELMGLPSNMLTTSYVMPYYNNAELNTQLRFGNVGTAPTNVTVKVGGVVQGTYFLLPSQALRISYAGLNSGPVKITSSGGVPIVASERVAYFDGANWTSFSELMGLPSNMLTTSYVMPWYNNAELNTQLRFGAP